MICRRVAVGSLCFVAGLIYSMSGSTDDAVKVEVERSRLVAGKAQSPLLAGFDLVFDSRFANQSENPVDIPDPDELSAGPIGITLNGVQTQQNDGSWRVVVNPGTLLWKGDTVFPVCKSLGPKETLEIKGVSSPLGLYKSQLTGLGTRPILRLTLVLSCKKGNGNVVLKTVQTSAFVLSVPTLP